MIAASEVAANTLRHTNGGGVVRLWETDAELLCQIEDTGYITDPLAGHWRPAGDCRAVRACGWSTRCATSRRSVPASYGTTIRLHMYRQVGTSRDFVARRRLPDAARVAASCRYEWLGVQHELASSPAAHPGRNS